MEKFTIYTQAKSSLGGKRSDTLTGVVASGNLEILFERKGEPLAVIVEVMTASHGYQHVWEAVIKDFVARVSPGGMYISIHDNGARPDTVLLRLMQGARLMEARS
ncbi:malonate decarboxylase acyl carrier protein [Acetobacter thailandicus]|uniref:Malonate decarboxylase acyl carrier protein n=1 Tax=Acetobacter thailandicus TaxID=1502842 RepID=A0ABT3QCR0_9PROT|nr:malonate decarboxylase acyl carrier protein [Acetobacter thailandicus]MCX2563065.1 malonate decarboxylase acyl carrier protein [Acetobacter thailandicus]NHN95783.1 malonate decarboxylase acyl carrier protein [Acetobacter thailandicus]